MRFGILGCADVAERRVLPALLAHNGVTPMAYASRDPERARRFAARFGGRACPSYDALIEHPDVDAVYVPLPPALRAPWIERALRAGKHVLGEKPLTTRADDTGRLFAFAAARSLVLMEHFSFVHHPMHAEVAQRIADGVIGHVRHFSAAFTIPPRPGSDIRYQAALGGGALLDAGVYPLRAALMLWSEPPRVEGAIVRRDPGREVDVAGTVLAAHGDVSMTLSFGMEHAYRSYYELHGSEGRLVLEDVFTARQLARPVLHLLRPDHHQAFTLPAHDQLASLVDAFLAAAAAGGHHAGIAASIAVARLVDEIAPPSTCARSRAN